MLFSQLTDFQKIGYLHCRFTQTPGGLLLKLLHGRAKAFLEDRDPAKNVKKRQFHPNYDDCKSDTSAHLPGGGASLWNLWSVRSVPTVIFVRTYKSDTNFSPIYTTKNKILKINSKEGEAVVNAPLKRGLPAQDASNEIKKIAFRIKKDQWKKKIKDTSSSVSNKKEIFLPPTRARGNFVPRTSSNDLVFDSNPVNQLKRQITKKKIENFAAKSGAINERFMRNKGTTPIRSIPSVANAGKIDLPSPFFFMEEARDNLSLRTSYSYPSKKDKSNVVKKVAKRVKNMVPDNDENIYPSPKLAEIKRSFDGSTSIVFNCTKRKLDSLSRIKNHTENIRLYKIIKKVAPTKISNENLTPHFPSPIFNQEFVDKLSSDSPVQNDVRPLEMPIKYYKSHEKQIHLKNSLNRNEITIADEKRRQLVDNSTARYKLIKESSDNIRGKMVVENHLKTTIEGIQNEEEKENTDKLILEARYRINSHLWPLEISTNKSSETHENQNYQNKTSKNAETLNVDKNRKYDSTTRNKLTEESSNQQNVKAALYLYQTPAADKDNQHKIKDEYEDVKISFPDETYRLNSRLWSLEIFNDKYPGFYKNQSSQKMTFRRVETLPADGVRRQLTDTLITRDKLLKESYAQQNVGGSLGTNLSTLGNYNQDKQKAFANLSGPNRNLNSQSVSWRKIETLYSDGVSRRQLVDKLQTRNNFLNQSPNIQYTSVATIPNPPVHDNSREMVEKQENNKTSNNASRSDFFALKKSIQSSRNMAQTNELTIISNLSETATPDTHKPKLFTWTKLKSLEVQNYCNSQMNKNNTGVHSSKSSKTILRPSEEQNVAKSTLINESTKDSNLILWNLINANLQVPQKLLGSQKQDADSQSTNECIENSNNSSTTLKNNKVNILDHSDCNEKKNVASQNNKIYDQGLANKDSDEIPQKSNAEYLNQNNKPLAKLVASDDKNDPLCKTTQPKFEEVNMINHIQSNSNNVRAETFGAIKEVCSEPTSLVENIHTLNRSTSFESNETQKSGAAGHHKVIDNKSPNSVEPLTQFEVNQKGKDICLKQKDDPNKDQEGSNQSDNSSTATVTLFQPSNSGAIAKSEQNNLLSKLPDHQVLQTTTQEASFGTKQINDSIKNNEQYYKMKVFPEVAGQQEHQLLNQGESCKTDQKNEQINYQELSGNSSTSDNSFTAIVLQLKQNSGACSKSEQNNVLSKLPDHQELQTVPAAQDASFGVDRINRYIENQEQQHYYKMNAYSDVTKQQEHQFSNKRENCKTDQTNEVINYQQLSGSLSTVADYSSTAIVQQSQAPNLGTSSKSEQNNHLNILPDHQEFQTAPVTQEVSFGVDRINKYIENQEHFYKMNAYPYVTKQQEHQLHYQGESSKTDQTNEVINYQELSGKSSTTNNFSTDIVQQSQPPNLGTSSKSEQNNHLNILPDHQEFQTAPVTQEASFGVDRINKYIENKEHFYKMNAYPDVTKQQEHQLHNQGESSKTDQTNEVINYQELSGKSSPTNNFSTDIVQQSQPPNLGTSSKSEQNNHLSKLPDHQELQTVPVAHKASFGVDQINKYIESQEQHYYKMNAYPDVTNRQEHQLPNQRDGCNTDQINELINYQELSGNSSTAADNSSTAFILQFQPPNLGATFKSEQNNILCKFSDQQKLLTVPAAQEASLGTKLNISMKNQDHHYYKMNATFEVICQEKHQLPNQGESCQTDPINELINNHEPYNKSINSSSNVQPQSSFQEDDMKIEQIGSDRSLNEFKNASSEISSQQLQLPIEIVSSKVDKINQCIKNQELDSKINEIKGLQLASSNKEITELTNQLIKPLELDNITRVFPEIRSLQPQSPVHDVSSSANKKHEQIKNNGSNCKKEASVKIASQKEFQVPSQGLSLTSDQTTVIPKVDLLDRCGNTKTDETNNMINNSAVNNKDPSLVVSKMEPSKGKERPKTIQRNYMEPNPGFSIKTYTSDVSDKQNQMPRFKKLTDFWPSGQTSRPSKHPCDLNVQNKYIYGKPQSFKNHQSEGCEKLTEKKIEKSANNQTQYETLPKLETRQSFNLLNDVTKRERAYKTSGDKSSEKKEIQNNSEKNSDAMSSSDKFDGNNNGRAESSNSNNDSNRKNLRNSYFHIGKAAFYLENVLKSVDGEKKREKLYFGGSRDEAVGEYTYAEKDRFVQPAQVKQDDSRVKYNDPSQNINNKTIDIIRSRQPVHKDKSGSSPNYPSDDDDEKRKSIYKLLEEISSKSDLTNSSGIYSYKKINQLNNKALESKSIAKDENSKIKAPAGVNVSTTQEINAVRTVKDPSPINSEVNKDLNIVNESKDIKSKSLDWFQQLMNRYNSINIKEESNRINAINTIKEPSLRGQEVSEKEKQIEFYNKSSSTGAIDTIPPNLIKNSNPYEWEKQKQISDWSSSISFPSKYHNIYESSKVYPPTTESHALPEHLINMDVNNYSFQRLNTHQNQNHGGYNFNRGGYNYVKGGYNVTSSSRGGYSHSKPIPNNPSINRRSNDFSDEFNSSLSARANTFNFSQLQPRIGPSLLTELTKHISDYFKKIVNQKTNIKLDAYESLISSKPSKSKINLIESTSTKRKQIFKKSLIPILSKNTFNKMTEPLNPIIGKINQKIDGDYMKSVLYDNTMKSFSKAAFARRVAKTPTPANISITGGCPTCDKLSQFSSNIQKGVPFMKTKKRLVSCNFCKGYRYNKRDDKVFESTNTAKEIYNNAVRMFSRSDESPLNYITKSRTGVGSNGTKYSYRISKSATFADTDSSSIQSNPSSSSISEKLSEEVSVKNSVKTSDLINNHGKRIEKSLSNIGNTLKKTSIHPNLPDTKTATIRKPDVKYSKKPSRIMVLASRMVSQNKTNAIKNPYKAFSDVS